MTQNSTQKQKRAAFARMSSRPIPRVERMMNVANELEFETVFLGARREDDLPDSDVIGGLNVKRVGPFFPLLNGRSPGLYIRSVIEFNFGIFKELSKIKPDVLHASDIETMPASVLYKLTSRCRLIYNIHDNLAQRYNPPGPIRALMNMAEGLAVRFSNTTLVPEAFRRDTLPKWCHKKINVVRNTPADRGIAELPELHAPIRIFFGGWLDRGRGLIQLLDLVKENEDFELTVAGEGDAELLELVKSNPRTNFIGFVSHERIMDETARCQVVSALYDPVRPINRYAASNKLAEALSRGRPALVNSEMLITEDLGPYNCLVAMPYADIPSQAADRLRALVLEDNTRYAKLSKDARQAYEDLYGWDIAHAAMVKALEV